MKYAIYGLLCIFLSLDRDVWSSSQTFVHNAQDTAYGLLLYSGRGSLIAEAPQLLSTNHENTEFLNKNQSPPLYPVSLEKKKEQR
jgi:hypothetical protein